MEKKFVKRLNDALNLINATSSTGRVAENVIDAVHSIHRAIRESLIEELTGREGITVRIVDGRTKNDIPSVIISHSADDWYLVEAIAKDHCLNCHRWMENNEPRTSIY